MARRVAIAGNFHLAGVDSLCERLAPLNVPAGAAGIELDLSALGDVSASALAVLISTLRSAREEGLCDPLISLRTPTELAHAGLLDAASLRRLVERPTDGRPDENTSQLCGCEPFSNVQGIVRAREALLTFIARQVTLDEAAKAAVKQLVWDLAQNVLRHADIGRGVAAARANAQDGTLELAIADRGIGIRESFVRTEAFDEIGDDVSAVLEAMRPGVTSEPGSGRGMGLFFTRLMLADNGGTLMVRSGHARVQEPDHTATEAPLPWFRGTLVTALARLDRPLDPEAVNRKLERPQGLASA
jgi:anti-sigma regulatory factor (Ser/Thr protein kinase)